MVVRYWQRVTWGEALAREVPVDERATRRIGESVWTEFMVSAIVRWVV